MKYCPKCSSEYNDNISKCADCGCALMNELSKNNDAEIMPEPGLVTVFTAMYTPEADFIKGALESAGIEAFIVDDNTVSVYPFLSNAIGGVKVKVDEFDAEDAKAIIKEYLDKKTIESDIKSLKGKKDGSKNVCIKCGSQNVSNYHDVNRSAVLVFCLSLVGLLLSPFLGKIFICNDCGEKWRVKN